MVLALVVATSAGVNSAASLDVKALVRTQFDAAAGVWGGFLTSLGGAGAKGAMVELSAKGNRLATYYPEAGPRGEGRAWIVDFDEQKTYFIMNDTRQYSVQTFSQVRNEVARQHQLAVEAIPGAEMFLPSTGVDLPAQSRGRAKRFRYTVETRETGQHRNILGHEAREIVLTITAVENGKSIGRDGGWVVTSAVWLAPRIAAVDELMAAQRRYVKATTKGIYDTAFTQVEFSLNQFFDPFYPEHAIVGMRVVAEIERLPGTALSSNTVYEIERTEKEMRGAQAQYLAQQRRLTSSGARVLGGAPPKRTRLVTMSVDYLSLDTTVMETDLMVPAGYMLKKR